MLKELILPSAQSWLQEVEIFGLGIAGRLRRLNATPRASSQDVMMVVNAITMIPLANCAGVTTRVASKVPKMTKPNSPAWASRKDKRAAGP